MNGDVHLHPRTKAATAPRLIWTEVPLTPLEREVMLRLTVRLAELVRQEPRVLHCPDGTLLSISVYTPPTDQP